MSNVWIGLVSCIWQPSWLAVLCEETLILLLLLLLLLLFTALSLGFTILGDMFVYVTVFSPTIEVVTFRLHG